MSQMHSHGPGQPMHSHGPPEHQQQQQMPVADPDVVAAIDESFREVSFKLATPGNHTVVCPEHNLEKCSDCGIDFTQVNQLAKLFVSIPELAIPPPPNMSTNQLSQLVTKTKEEGNNHYKASNFQKARDAYSIAVTLSMGRRPWEAANQTREEVAVSLSNRSAALAGANDHVGALVDATAVIGLRRPWSKGHLRKGKALISLGRPDEAREAVALGLTFEPTNSELLQLKAAIDTILEKRYKETSSLSTSAEN